MTEHIETRHKLKEIRLVNDFEAILAQCMLSEQEKQILRMIYIEKKDLRYIGDKLGFTERQMKNKHKQILKVLKAVL